MKFNSRTGAPSTEAIVALQSAAADAYGERLAPIVEPPYLPEAIYQAGAIMAAENLGVRWGAVLDVARAALREAVLDEIVSRGLLVKQRRQPAGGLPAGYYFAHGQYRPRSLLLKLRDAGVLQEIEARLTPEVI